MDGTKAVLEDPTRAELASDEGGLFWVVQHKDGQYRLLASELYEYHELQTQPSKGPAASETLTGVY